MLIPISALAALRSHCDKESSRYALGCILLERQLDGSPVAIATDGRRMAAFSWVEPAEHPHKPADETPDTAFSLLLSPEALAAICGWKLDKKWLRLKPQLGFVYIPENLAEGEPVTVSATDLSAVYRVERARGDGRFPKWRDVFSPKLFDDSGIDPRTASSQIDSRYMAEASTLAGKLVNTEEHRGLALTLNTQNSEGPIAVRASHNGARLAVVLMPLACNGARGDAGQWNPTGRPRGDSLESATAELAHWANEALVSGALMNRLAKLAQESAYAAEHRAIDAGLVQQLADDAEARYKRIEAKRLEASARVAHFQELAAAMLEAAQQAAEAEAAAESEAATWDSAPGLAIDTADDSPVEEFAPELDPVDAEAEALADSIFGSVA